MLQPEVAHLVGRRPAECEAGRLACLCETGVLAEKAITWMDRASARSARRFDELVLAKITLRRRRAAEAYCLVGTQYVQRVLIYIRIDGHRADTHTTQSALDTAGDGAT